MGGIDFDGMGDAAGTPVATVGCIRDEFNRTSRGIALLARELNMLSVGRSQPNSFCIFLFPTISLDTRGQDASDQIMR
jgi:hypothetical protein